MLQEGPVTLVLMAPEDVTTCDSHTTPGFLMAQHKDQDRISGADSGASEGAGVKLGLLEGAISIFY